MKKMYCDLHTHSYVSDGRLSINELVDEAKKAGIDVLAITDHDIYAPEIEKLKTTVNDIHIVTGAEFSMKYSTCGKEITVHVIGLFFDHTDAGIQRLFSESRANQEAYIKAILSKLSAAGMDISYEEVLDANPDKSVLGRVPIARLMVQKGFPGCETVYGAMDNWIGSLGLRKCYVEALDYLNFPSMAEGIAVIRNAGGIAILCHPYYYKLDDLKMEKLAADFKACAGDAGGIEVYYKDYSEEQVKTLEKIAKKYKLLPSAGSDFHGQSKSEYLSHHFPVSIYEALRQRKEEL